MGMFVGQHETDAKLGALGAADACGAFARLRDRAVELLKECAPGTEKERTAVTIVSVANAITGAVARLPEEFWALAMALNEIEIKAALTATEGEQGREF